MVLSTILATGIFTLTLNAAPEPAKPDPAVAQQLADAQAKAAQLQGTLAQNAPRPTASPAASSMPGMTSPAASATPMAGMGADKMMMGKMEMMMNKMEKMMPMMEKMMGMGAMGGGGGGMGMDMDMGMGMGDDKMDMAGMMGMGSMGGAPAASMADSASPGSPGASRLYHCGATGFFLDHQQYITLTTEQQVALNKIKDQAQLAKSAAGRAIEQAEQELAALTAGDQPDFVKVEAKVRDIAKMASDQRIAFIRAVGEAAKSLTAEHRKILTGFAPPSSATPMTAPAASATPMPMNDM